MGCWKRVRIQLFFSCHLAERNSKLASHENGFRWKKLVCNRAFAWVVIKQGLQNSLISHHVIINKMWNIWLWCLPSVSFFHGPLSIFAKQVMSQTEAAMLHLQQSPTDLNQWVSSQLQVTGTYHHLSIPCGQLHCGRHLDILFYFFNTELLTTNK